MSPLEEMESQWSPDGLMLAYGSGKAGNQNVAIIDVATGEETLLTEEITFVHATTWSPNGRHIAYVTGTQTEKGVTIHVFIVDVESKAISHFIKPGREYGYLDGGCSPIVRALIRAAHQGPSESTVRIRRRDDVD